ncbi:ribonuclease Z [Kineosporia succinea]|uniref:Ribonuclease Z n=1 Tax=Kineosporia succinea TaxID=84632 RepID=A0ABT9NXR5_9ACTN|nr:ribonuclease Z [Kineosporia succinea]MDP9825062.1 ribonuclease Z [Kineosporia succinea]
MSRREVVTLGTSCQIPTRERNHVATYLRLGDLGVLVDCGEGTQRQVVRAGLRTSQIDALFLTHEHGDHTYGVPGLLNRRRVEDVPGPLPVAAPAEAIERLSLLTSFATNGPEPLHEWIPAGHGEVLRLRSWTVRSAPLRHRVPTVGYRFTEDDSRTLIPAVAAEHGVTGPDLGRLQRGETVRGVSLADVSVPRPGQRVAVIMDTAVCDGALELAQGCDLLVSEATYNDDQVALAETNGHLTARQAAELAVAAGVRRLVLTHFSSRYEDLTRHLDEAREVHPDVVVACDLQVIPVPGRIEQTSSGPEGAAAPTAKT